VLTVTVPRAYRVPAGAQRTVQLTLSAAARRVLAARRSLRVRVALAPAAGDDAARILDLTR
jgi:hypothetical protein